MCRCLTTRVVSPPKGPKVRKETVSRVALFTFNSNMGPGVDTFYLGTWTLGAYVIRSLEVYAVLLRLAIVWGLWVLISLDMSRNPGITCDASCKGL